MIKLLKYKYNLWQSIRREKKKEKTRSPHWFVIKNEYLKTHPLCEGCSSPHHVQVHHVMPYHIYPELELVPSNFRPLCMDKSMCHLLVGHSGRFDGWNSNLIHDLEELKKFPDRREEIVARAKLNIKF